MAKRAALSRISLAELRRRFDAFETTNPDLEKPPDAPQQTLLYPLIKRASETGDPYVYSFALQLWLSKIGLKPPDGVFVDIVSAPSGRPLEEQKQLQAWVTFNLMEDPSDSKLAEKLIPREWKRNKKKAHDKVAKRRKRFEARVPETMRKAFLESVFAEARDNTTR